MTIISLLSYSFLVPTSCRPAATRTRAITLTVAQGESRLSWTAWLLEPRRQLDGRHPLAKRTAKPRRYACIVHCNILCVYISPSVRALYIFMCMHVYTFMYACTCIYVCFFITCVAFVVVRCTRLLYHVSSSPRLIIEFCYGLHCTALLAAAIGESQTVPHWRHRSGYV
jgi:hypothetical protein